LLRFAPCKRTLKTRHKQMFLNRDGSIQAIERERGYVQTSSGQIVQGLKSTYKRHGTVNLFAALEVATGVLHGRDRGGLACRPRNSHHFGQFKHPQKMRGMAQCAPQCHLSFHPHQRKLAQPSRDMVWHFSTQDAEY
jgi:hypothetical protein